MAPTERRGGPGLSGPAGPRISAGGTAARLVVDQGDTESPSLSLLSIEFDEI